MDSFYAGLPGTPFILKQRFPSKQAMIDEFKKQEKYTDVFYGEYCIIDTVNKSHPDNGKIYRRGYSEPEYIGQVVGPSGLFCDNIRIITRDYIENKCFEANGDEVTVCNSGKSSWGKIEELVFENYDFSLIDKITESDGSKKPRYKKKYKIIVYDIYENVLKKEDENTESENEEDESKYAKKIVATCFAGVYDVLESMQEYQNGETVLRYSSSPDKILADKNGNSIIKSWLENVSFNPNTGQLIFTGNGCNETLNKVFFLKLLKNVKLDPDGTIHFLYTNKGEQGQPGSQVEIDESLDRALTWIKDVRLNKNTGQFQIHFNNDKVSSPVVIENLAVFDDHYNYGYKRRTNPKYYFEEILLNPEGFSGFYVKMGKITKDNFSEDSNYKIESETAIDKDSILGEILYPTLTINNPDINENESFYLYKPCYTKNPLEIEIKKSIEKEAYLNNIDSPLIKTDKNENPVKLGELTDEDDRDGSLKWKDLEENVLYRDNTNKIIAQIGPQSFDEKSKAQVLFNESPLYEINWPLAEDGSFIETTINGITYRKISFEKEVKETSSDKTGNLTFGEEDGSFSYKFIGQEGVSGQFNFVKKVEENNLGYTTVTNTRNQTSFSKTQNFRIPKEFFFYSGNDYSDYSFHLFANYSYPKLLLKELDLVPLSERKEDNPIGVGTYYISTNREEIYEGISGESGNIYQRVTNSDKIFYYQEICYQIGENGAVEEFSIKEYYPFDTGKEPDKEKEFWNQLQVKQGYWEDLGKISDGLTNDLPSLLANIAYTIEDPKITSEETKNKILWR